MDRRVEWKMRFNLNVSPPAEIKPTTGAVERSKFFTVYHFVEAASQCDSLDNGRVIFFTDRLVRLAFREIYR
jgi:hypothetical protein